MTHFSKQLTHPVQVFSRWHFAGWTAVLKGEGAADTMCFQRERGFCGAGLWACAYTGVVWSSLLTGAVKRLLAQLTYVTCFDEALSSLSNSIKSTVETMGVSLWLKFLEETFSLHTVLAKTGDLSWHHPLCLSLLVLVWLRIEPILSFSFIQGSGFEFPISLRPTLSSPDAWD